MNIDWDKMSDQLMGLAVMALVVWIGISIYVYFS